MKARIEAAVEAFRTLDVSSLPIGGRGPITASVVLLAACIVAAPLWGIAGALGRAGGGRAGDWEDELKSALGKK